MIFPSVANICTLQHPKKILHYPLFTFKPLTSPNKTTFLLTIPSLSHIPNHLFFLFQICENSCEQILKRHITHPFILPKFNIFTITNPPIYNSFKLNQVVVSYPSHTILVWMSILPFLLLLKSFHCDFCFLILK